MRGRTLLIPSAVLLAAPFPAKAGPLQISPVLIDVPAPAAAGKVELHNKGLRPFTAQVRLYRWSQQNGSDRLAGTRDVVASPPLVQMDPNTSHLVRIVRTSKEPRRAEESYRLQIDEIPETSAARTGIRFAVRYSIPVFFSGPTVSDAAPVWTIRRRDGKMSVAASNPGDRRIRIASLRIGGEKTGVLPFGDGLAGYVLSRSTRTWTFTGALPALPAGSRVEISAQTEQGLRQTRAKVE